MPTIPVTRRDNCYTFFIHESSKLPAWAIKSKTLKQGTEVTVKTFAMINTWTNWFVSYKQLALEAPE